MGECLLRQLRRLDAGQPNHSVHPSWIKQHYPAHGHAIGPSGIDDILGKPGIVNRTCCPHDRFPALLHPLRARRDAVGHFHRITPGGNGNAAVHGHAGTAKR